METNPSISPRLRFLGYAACFAASCLWGTGFYFSRLALNEMSVNYMVLYRILFACLGVLPVALVCRVRFTGREWRTLLLSAAFGIPISCLLQFGGLSLTTVSHASLMVGAMPVMLAVAAALFAPKGSTEERLGRLGWLALFASTAGAALITQGGSHATSHGAAMRDQPSLAGDLLVLVSLVAALAWILLSKKLMLSHSPSAVSAYTILAGGAMLLPWVMGSWIIIPLTHAHVAPPPFAHVSWTAWSALAFAGLMCTASTTLLWNWGIHHVPASRAGVFLNLEPMLGSFLGVQLLGEHLGSFAWIGGGLILSAALALTTQNHQPEPNILLE
jgi:drug/metabolite transporter (DMT)-like permease